MSRYRLWILVKILRCDDKATRANRKSIDKFAPIREIFNLLNDTFLIYFTPGKNDVITEMLSLFRRNCPFKLFMNENPGKYGILIGMLADCLTHYIIGMEIYENRRQHINFNSF